MICKHIILITFLNKPKFILLHAVKWFQVFFCIMAQSARAAEYTDCISAEG